MYGRTGKRCPRTRCERGRLAATSSLQTEKLGVVKEFSGHFQVDAPVQPDYWLPARLIVDIEEGGSVKSNTTVSCSGEGAGEPSRRPGDVVIFTLAFSAVATKPMIGSIYSAFGVERRVRVSAQPDEHGGNRTTRHRCCATTGDVVRAEPPSRPRAEAQGLRPIPRAIRRIRLRCRRRASSTRKRRCSPRSRRRSR